MLIRRVSSCLPFQSVSTAATTKKRFVTWNDFDEIFEFQNSKKVRTATKSKHCKKVYSGPWWYWSFANTFQVSYSFGS